MWHTDMRVQLDDHGGHDKGCGLPGRQSKTAAVTLGTSLSVVTSASFDGK